MALIDKASLLMVPSTYEAGTLYNVLPSGNRAPDSTDQNSGYDQTRADFDFDRGSNASATRIGSDGLIKKYRENFLLQSNNFSNGWSLTTGSSITGGQTGYDGSNDAWLLNDSGNSTAYAIYRGYTNTGVQTFSLYAKQASTSQIEFDFLGGSGGYLRVELTDGSLHQTNNSIDYNIENVGNGWYRCSFAVNQTSAPILVRIGCNGAGSVYIQNAQVEKGLVASSYLDSTSVTAKAGVLVDLPRINYDANGENGSLLLEPSRANSVISSEYLGDSSWAATRMTQAPNQTTSPEGLVNATLIANTTDTGGHSFSDLLGSYTNAQIALTCYVKKKDSDYFQIGMYNSPTKWAAQKFNIATGVALGSGNTGFHDAPSNVDIVDAGNGWWRVQATFSTSLTAASEHIYLLCPYDDSNPTGSFGHYNGWTGSTSENAYVYGIQAEASATYPSSYIPTMGTSETRAGDSCLDAGNSDVFNDSEGVLFIESSALSEDSTNKVITISDGTTTNRVQIYYNSSNNIVGGVAGQSAISYSSDITQNKKIAFKYKANDFALWVNGVEVGTDNVGSAPSGLNQIDFHNGATSSPFYGNMKEIIYFPEALSDSELATLTTL